MIFVYGKIDFKGLYFLFLYYLFWLEKSLLVFVYVGGSEVLCDDIWEFCKCYKEYGW